jgi:hypothetical protein
MLPRSRHPSEHDIIDVLRPIEHTRSVVFSQKAPSARLAQGSVALSASIVAVSETASTRGAPPSINSAESPLVAEASIARTSRRALAASELISVGSAQAAATLKNKTTARCRRAANIKGADRNTGFASARNDALI